MTKFRWQDWVAIVLGCWLIVSPWQMEYTLHHAATANASGVGVVLVVYNLIAVGRLVEQGQEIFNIMAGCWLVLSPYALDFSSESGATINAIAVGVAVVILAFWQLFDATRRKKKE